MTQIIIKEEFTARYYFSVDNTIHIDSIEVDRCSLVDGILENDDEFQRNFSNNIEWELLVCVLCYSLSVDTGKCSSESFKRSLRGHSVNEASGG